MMLHCAARVPPTLTLPHRTGGGDLAFPPPVLWGRGRVGGTRAKVTLFFALTLATLALLPNSVYAAPLKLSLEETIALAIRDNPNVQQAKLSYVVQKFNLEVQEWQFQPHYSIGAAGTIAKTKANNETQTTHRYNVEPTATLVSPFGTQMKLSATNNIITSYQPGLSLEIMQPLLRGFGRPIVEAALYNARDSEHIAKLNVEAALRSTVTTVINAYLDVVSAQHTITIDEDAEQRAAKSVEQTRLFIKAGRKAGTELVTVQANLASAKSKLENDRNALKQASYALLSAIGLDPNLDVAFTSLNIANLIKKYPMPTIETAKHLTLENDIQYQIDQITLHGSTTRSLLTAEDSSRWQLNFTANAGVGSGLTGQQNSGGVESLINGQNQVQGASLTLQIPLNDKLAKQAVLSAKVALQEAEIALRQERWSKETSAINGHNNIVSSERALHFAEEAEQLQNKTYGLNFQKYLHGLIDSLELQSAQLQLIQTQQSTLYSRVSYLKSLVNMDLLIGHTLKTWEIEVRV